MNLLKQFEQYISAEDLFKKKDRLIVAVSGGVDSLVLCDLCKAAGYDFSMAHCNFQLRGKESDDDEEFVTRLAGNYGVKLFIKKFDTQNFATATKTGIQEAARNLRYEWFRELLTDPFFSVPNNTNDSWGSHVSNEKKLVYVLTAHHANDNIETVLMNFFKGTGLNGLQGIMPKQGMAGFICHPLLFASKEEILQYANSTGIAYREDSSNSSDKYTRNYIRNQLLPSIKKIFPGVESSLLENIRKFKEINYVFRQSIDSIKKRLVIEKGNEIHIPVLKLVRTPSLNTVIYEIIRDHGFTPGQVDVVVQLLSSESGKYVQSSSHRILRNRKWLIISPLHSPVADFILIEEGQKEIDFSLGKLLIETKEIKKILSDQTIAQVNASQLSYPLFLRKWKKGDYFYPLGMQKKKKLSRFFIDGKLSLNEKENCWLIESDKRIIWVVGKRIDDRFKVFETTTKVIQFTLMPK